MIPTTIFIIITLVIVALAAFYFLVGQDGKIPYSDMLSCILGFFLSLYLAVQSAAGNVGESTVQIVNNTAETIAVPMIDSTLSFLYILFALLFIGCMLYSLLNIFRRAKYERSL